MQSAKVIREGFHDLLCASSDICDFDESQWHPDFWLTLDETRSRAEKNRDEHARLRFSKPARDFRKCKTEGAAIKVFHDTICRVGDRCPKGTDHLSEKAKDIARRWFRENPTKTS